jgi:hydroxyquinol 1,2-dioxygenase
MRNIDEFNITRAVLESLEGCDDPRLKEIMGALVCHLHDFAREIRLTEAELMRGIAFLTAAGQKCDDKRQELILLSDTLGLSMLTVALNNARPGGATEATVFGPFHVHDAPRMAQGDDIAAGAPGEPLDVDLCVCALDGMPIPHAEVDVWQADEQGLYDVQIPTLGSRRRARAVMKADVEGRLRFRSIVPTAYPIPTDGPVGEMLVATGRHPWRPAHVHFMVKAAGYQTLITHVFREGDPYLDSDVVFGVRNSLVASFDGRDAQGRRRLDLRLVLAPLEP